MHPGPFCVQTRFFFRCAEQAEYKTNTSYAPYVTTSNGFIPPHGGYENLLSFKKAKIVFDGTVVFCKRFLEKRDRTVDQMVQAARSGKQNIVEGSLASGTSKETEIKLVNVARASLGELLEDYHDFFAHSRFATLAKE